MIQFCSVAEIAEVCEVKWRMSIDISAAFRLLSCIHVHIFCFTLQNRTLQDSLANAKVSEGFVYEGPLTKKSTANERKEHNVEKYIQLLLLRPKYAKFCEIWTYTVQGHPRSSILVSIESAYATSC